MTNQSNQARQVGTESDAVLVGSALLRASEHVDIGSKVLSRIVGLSESSLSRMR